MGDSEANKRMDRWTGGTQGLCGEVEGKDDAFLDRAGKGGREAGLKGLVVVVVPIFEEGEGKRDPFTARGKGKDVPYSFFPHTVEGSSAWCCWWQVWHFFSVMFLTLVSGDFGFCERWIEKCGCTEW